MRQNRFNFAGVAFLAVITVTMSINPTIAKDQMDPGINLDYCKAAAAYSAGCKGVSMLVMQNGKIVFEDYPNGHNQNEPHELASGTKSFAGVAAVAAMEDGILSLDEKVSETITEWKGDPRRENITIRQMLNLVSGIKSSSGIAPTYAEAIKSEINAKPEEIFQYGAQSFQIFGELMRRKLSKTKENLRDYLKRRVFQPADIHYGFWRDGRDHLPLVPQGGGFTAREWAKFGEMLRLKGKANGKQILKEEDIPVLFTGTPANPMYGLTFWLNRPMAEEKRSQIRLLTMASDLRFGTRGVPDDLVMAAGAGKQRLYICPSLGLVVVRQADGIGLAMRNKDATGFSDNAFWQYLTEGKADQAAIQAEAAPNSQAPNSQAPNSQRAGGRREAIMRIFDRNHDGTLDQSERQKLRELMQKRRQN